MNKKGSLIILVGPSGSGKGTVLKKVLEHDKNTFVSISATTRKPRPGEIDGESYYFLPREEFISRRDKNEMLEYAEYCGNFYGTPKEAVTNRLSAGQNVILEIEMQGAAKVKAAMPEAVTIFIMPPSIEVLRRRLTDRKTEDEETINRRMTAAAAEINYGKGCDFAVINDNADVAAEDIAAIIRAESCSNRVMKEFLDSLK